MPFEDASGTAAQAIGTDPSKDAAQTDASATAGPEAAPESFFDPAQVPVELQPVYKKMQGSFTKRMQQMAAIREKADLVDKFNEDPDFALQTIQQAAQRLGLSMTQAQAANQPAGVATTSVNVPPEILSSVQGVLPSELQWMAPMIAASTMAVMNKQLMPLQQSHQIERDQSRKEEFNTLEEELNEMAPGWQEHEDEMGEMLDFLKSDRMRHRKYGSKLQLLHSLVTSNSAAVATALQRQRDAALARTVVGGVGRTSMPNVEDKVMKAPNLRDAFKVAADSAIRTLESEGHRFEQ